MKSVIIQCLASIIICLANFLLGFGVVWPSYVNPYLANNNVLDVVVTKNIQAMIASLPMLGCFIGTLLYGLVVDRLGQKRTLILNGLMNVLGWSIISTGRTVNLILIARLITGVAGGAHTPLSNVYTSECVSIELRGTFGSISVLSYLVGALISNMMGWWCSYEVISYTMLTIAVFNVVFGCFLKDSPYCFMRKGLEKEALNSLMYYRGASEINDEILKEYETIKTTKNEEKTDQTDDKIANTDEKLQPFIESNQVKPETTNPFKVLLHSKAAQRSIITVTTLMTLLSFTGSITIQAHAGTFFKQAVPSLSPDLCAVILAVANIVGCGLSMVTIERFGRRILMVTSNAVLFAILMTLATLLQWNWAPIWCVPLLMVLYSLVQSVGPGNVPIILLGEAFSDEIRSLATTTVVSTMWICNFVLLAIFPSMEQTIGLSGCFLLYGIVAMSSGLISFFILPETAGLSMKMIQDSFERSWTHWRD